MTNFKEYSNYYDSFYKDKNYQKEIGFLEDIIKRYSSIEVESILSLGCGTAAHDALLAKKGFRITGIDKSEEMLKIAKEKTRNLPVEFRLCDISNFYLDEKFDFAIAMFNVVGYQTENSSMEGMLKSTACCLKEGGLFVFDCWYLPAVLKERPFDKEKEMDGVVRKTKQTLNIENNFLNINFQVFKEGEKIVDEDHGMRFWTLPELKYFLKKSGFELVRACKFLDLDSDVSENNWDMFIIAKKI